MGKRLIGICYFGSVVGEVTDLALDLAGTKVVIVFLHDFSLSSLLCHHGFDEGDLLVEEMHVSALKTLGLPHQSHQALQLGIDFPLLLLAVFLLIVEGVHHDLQLLID